MNREEDAKTHDFSDTEMDKWFYGMIEKEKRKHKIVKASGIAAGIVLAVSVALNGFTQVAYGESIVDIIRNSIEVGQFTITAISKNNDKTFNEYDAPIIQYEADSIEELFEQIIADTQTEKFFYVTGVPEQYKQWNAKYNKRFQKLTIYSQNSDDYLFISEELNYENIVSGTILESEIVSTVYNENLRMNVDVVEQMVGVRGSGYYIEIFYNNMRVKIEGNGTLEEFENTVKNISIRG